jgi:hypothetical protein
MVVAGAAKEVGMDRARDPIEDDARDLDIVPVLDEALD